MTKIRHAFFVLSSQKATAAAAATLSDDDIFDKLDASRVERIMELVISDSFGQIFITDTNRTHLDEIMSRTGGDYRMWMVENGIFSPMHS